MIRSVRIAIPACALLLATCSTQTGPASVDLAPDAVVETVAPRDLSAPEATAQDLARNDVPVLHDLLRPDDIQDVRDELDPIDIPLDSEPPKDGPADLHAENDVAADALVGEVQPLPELADVWPIGLVDQSCQGGLLATLETPSGPIKILVLRGSHLQMGRQAGCLIGAGTGQFMTTLLAYFTQAIQEEAAKMGLAPEQTTTLLISMLNNIWLHMEPYVDQRFLDEFQGFEEVTLGTPEIAQHWTETKPDWALRAFVLLSNLSDLNWDDSIEGVLQKLEGGASQQLLDFYTDNDVALLMQRVTRRLAGHLAPLPMRTTCSFFAAWGPRTVDGHLLASRNLDWSTDTGVSQMKGITFFAPTGGTVHASIGYLGFLGALAGISRAGIVLSEVGSESTMERLTGQPWTLKFREVLEDAQDLDEAVALLSGISKDGKIRPPTIGYNWMAGFGDPAGEGVNASAAAVENNGIVAGIMRQTPACDQETQVVQYGPDGTVADVVTHADDPLLANLEANALEIDAEGAPRLFTTDEAGELVLDGNGCPTLSPNGTGAPFTVGRPLSCALFRGDEALVHAVRRWQTASNGPQGGDKLLCTSGSYRHRYLVMHDMLTAYEEGKGYQHNGQTYIEATGSPVPVGLPQAEQIARAAAMSSNVMSIAYDATALAIRFSYETGTGAEWQGAHQHGYQELSLAPAFDLLANLPMSEGE